MSNSFEVSDDQDSQHGGRAAQEPMLFQQNFNSSDFFKDTDRVDDFLFLQPSRKRQKLDLEGDLSEDLLAELESYDRPENIVSTPFIDDVLPSTSQTVNDRPENLPSPPLIDDVLPSTNQDRPENLPSPPIDELGNLSPLPVEGEDLGSHQEEPFTQSNNMREKKRKFIPKKNRKPYKNTEATFSVDFLDDNYFVLDERVSRSFRGNVAAEMTYGISFKQMPTADVPFRDFLPHLVVLFERLIDSLIEKFGSDAVCRIFIDSANLEKEIVIPVTRITEMNYQLIFQYVDKVLQSAGHIPIDDTLSINVALARLIAGSGRKQVLNVGTDLKFKRSCVVIQNEDNLCLARAIVVGVAHLKYQQDKSLKKEYDRLRNSRTHSQRDAALQLLTQAGLSAKKEGSLDDIPQIENALKIAVVVISSVAGNKTVYVGNDSYTQKIFLYHTLNSKGKGHFDTITKVNAMMCHSYYCETCRKGFKNRTDHSCPNWCCVCGRKGCKKEQGFLCEDCNRFCRSQECFDAHKLPTFRGKEKLPSLCQKKSRCPVCGILLEGERSILAHICGEVYCSICRQFYFGEQHLCHMRSHVKVLKTAKFIFYDFECYRDEETGKHIPNYVVAHSICEHCQDEEVTAFSKCDECGSRCQFCGVVDKKEGCFERSPCDSCGFRQVIFKGDQTQESFCKWLFTPFHKGFTTIAHNARSYDAYFLYEYLMRNGIVPKPVIFSGSKIMFMNVGKGLDIRVLDSLNFLPMPLSSFPKSFDLKEKKKGFFPHLLNHPSNFECVLPNLPDIKLYDPDNMSFKKRKEFFEWYEVHKNQSFNFQDEMRDYCISDVDILLNGCWRFRRLWMESVCDGEEDNEDGLHLVNSVDPFAYLTIASLCLGVFRGKFLPEKWAVLTPEHADPNCLHELQCSCKWIPARKQDFFSSLEVEGLDGWRPIDFPIIKEKFVESPIGLIPPHGYSGPVNHSCDAILWMKKLERDFLNEGKVVKIQHARSFGGEKEILYCSNGKSVRYRVDGYFVLNGVRYVCEFYGCNFHGCRKCFKEDREKTVNNNVSLAQRFRNTVLKEKRLRELGYVVLTKWSCVFAKEKCKDRFLMDERIEPPINLRDCYFGGRTNGIVLYKQVIENERIMYLDFTSLYPDVMKNRRYPKGHPIRVIDDFLPPSLKPCEGECFFPSCDGQHLSLQYFGIIKAKFLPPTDLLHPVLPVRCNGKLKFPLCKRCADLENMTDCLCPAKDRSFVGTFCTPEVNVALNMGYQIETVYEVLHWQESSMYCPKTKEGGLFSQYINTFLKIKQEASGFPIDVDSEADECNYIEEYFEHEGVCLEKEKVKKNPGMRSLAKLALNSFYGKFGQRLNMKQTLFVSEAAQLYNILMDKTKQVTSFHVINDEILEVEYENAQDFEPPSLTTNVVIAAFVTTWARLKLWALMNKLGEQVLYHDTDSVIFSFKGNSDDYNPPLGNYLGQLTNELSCKELGCVDSVCAGHWIVEFVSCGPKNYAYRLNSGESFCKVRGFSLNYQTSQVINFESMKECLFSWIEKKPQPDLITVKTEFRRKKHNPTVYTREIVKHYGVVYDKRRVLQNFTTVPFGYRR